MDDPDLPEWRREIERSKREGRIAGIFIIVALALAAIIEIITRFR